MAGRQHFAHILPLRKKARSLERSVRQADKAPHDRPRLHLFKRLASDSPDLLHQRRLDRRSVPAQKMQDFPHGNLRQRHLHGVHASFAGLEKRYLFLDA